MQRGLPALPGGTFAVCHGQRAGIPRKPAPDGALLLAEELGVLPGDCLYIGDTDVDMETGRAAGMETVGVLWGSATARSWKRTAPRTSSRRRRSFCRSPSDDARKSLFPFPK